MFGCGFLSLLGPPGAAAIFGLVAQTVVGFELNGGQAKQVVCQRHQLALGSLALGMTAP